MNEMKQPKKQKIKFQMIFTCDFVMRTIRDSFGSIPWMCSKNQYMIPELHNIILNGNLTERNYYIGIHKKKKRNN